MSSLSLSLSLHPPPSVPLRSLWHLGPTIGGDEETSFHPINRAKSASEPTPRVYQLGFQPPFSTNQPTKKKPACDDSSAQKTGCKELPPNGLFAPAIISRRADNAHPHPASPWSNKDPLRGLQNKNVSFSPSVSLFSSNPSTSHAGALGTGLRWTLAAGSKRKSDKGLSRTKRALVPASCVPATWVRRV